MLLTGSGDELCGLLSALFQTTAYHLPTVILLPLQSLFTENSPADQLLVLPLSPMHSEYPAPSAASSFSVPYLLLRFFFWVTVSLSRGLCWFILGDKPACHLFAHLLVCISKGGLELESGGMGAFLFS
jgi:hypothetical protein